jgi:hypothetical protein
VLGALGRHLLLLLEKHGVELRERGLEIAVERLPLLVRSLRPGTTAAAPGSAR